MDSMEKLSNFLQCMDIFARTSGQQLNLDNTVELLLAYRTQSRTGRAGAGNEGGATGDGPEPPFYGHRRRACNGLAGARGESVAPV